MLLYVIRHADPIYDPDSLTEKGKRQAEAVGRRLSVHGLDKIFTSPMNRAKMTAQPACELLRIKPQVLEFVSEALAAEYFGFNDPERDNRWAWSFGINPTRYKNEQSVRMGDKWYEAYPFCLTKAKEGYENLIKSSDEFMESLGYKREGLKYKILKPNNERVAVFCHYGAGMTWLSHLLGIDPVTFWSTFTINHSGVTIINFPNNSDGYTIPQVLAFSDVSHFYGDRLPMQFTNEIDI